MKIHHVQEAFEDRWDLDPVRGAVKQRVTVLKPSDVHRVVIEDVQFERDKDGSFDVPDAVGAVLCSRRGWHEGLPPFAPGEEAPRPTRARAG